MNIYCIPVCMAEIFDAGPHEYSKSLHIQIDQGSVTLCKHSCGCNCVELHSAASYSDIGCTTLMDMTTGAAAASGTQANGGQPSNGATTMKTNEIQDKVYELYLQLGATELERKQNIASDWGQQISQVAVFLYRMAIASKHATVRTWHS